MSCEGCDRPSGGIYIAGCRGCGLRSALRSPEHHAARKAKKLLPAYQARLLMLGDIETTHAEVKALAAQLEG